MDRRIRPIVFLIVVWLVCGGSTAHGEPIGTAWTYQGRLIDNNDVAHGIYDFQFGLFDSTADGNQLGGNVNLDSVKVEEGYFTVELDFGDVFDGNTSWLEIGVRPGEQSDPNVFTTLVPRQEVTPTPYAIYAKSAGSNGDWIVSGNDMYSIPVGNVGIGVATPYAKLHIQNIPSDGDGLLVFSPNGGNARIGLRTNTGAGHFENEWHLLAEAGGKFHIVDGRSFDVTPSGVERISIGTNGNVGIGTPSPGAKLEVNGPIKITDGSQGAGKVLTSDASGLASWQTPPNGGETYYWSCVGAHFHSQYNDTSNTKIDRDGAYIEAEADGIFFFAPVMLPDGVSVTKIVVYGNGAATAEDWAFRKINLNSTDMSVVESAKIGTEVTCSTPRIINNSAYAYLLWTTSLDTGDIIYNARITYTH